MSFLHSIHKQSLEGCMQKECSGKFPKFIEKHLCQNLFFYNVAGFSPATSLKSEFFAKFFMSFFADNLFTETCEQLLLSIANFSQTFSFASQSAFTYSRSPMETPQQCVKFDQS